MPVKVAVPVSLTSVLDRGPVAFMRASSAIAAASSYRLVGCLRISGSLSGHPRVRRRSGLADLG
jgi:hypothetical protein